jgi:tetratricopeptide (TPR) repeat protein
MDNKQRRAGAHLRFLSVCVIVTSIFMCGCAHFYEGSLAGSSFKEANDLFNQGSYRASLTKYEQIIEKYPTAGDRVLFEMGIIYAYSSNEQKAYQKSLECFQKILKDYPGSNYRRDSAEMISHINNVTIKDKQILAQQTRITTLEQEVGNKENKLSTLQKRIEALERELRNKVFVFQNGPASKILIEKGERRLSLISKDTVLKSYRIALGGNPNGPKERKGDGKTPEGTYIIDSKNAASGYHLSLHISYPNDKDKRRAKELGVSPGGNIMIHGLKNGFSRIGDLHTELDWTEGCIAVTDEEIEEIANLVPNGTTVEIKP